MTLGAAAICNAPVLSSPVTGRALCIRMGPLQFVGCHVVSKGYCLPRLHGMAFLTVRWQIALVKIIMAGKTGIKALYIKLPVFA